jgi:DNA-binding IclR family transcriptional regulator
VRHERPILAFLRRWEGRTAGTFHIAEVVKLPVPVVAHTLRALAKRGAVIQRPSLHRLQLWMVEPEPAADRP